MKLLFNSYTWIVRGVPVYIAILPIGFACSAWSFELFETPSTGVFPVVLLPLAYFLGHIASEFGKQQSAPLFDKWGGPPTSRYLRHENKEYNRFTRIRIHKKLIEFGLTLPTVEEEITDRKKAMELYDSAVDELRLRTRDPTSFNLVYQHLTEYGFRRTLFGLRWIGRWISVGALGASIAAFLTVLSADEEISTLALISSFISVCTFIAWAFGANESALKKSAERYARSLLEATLYLEVSK